MSTPLMRQYTEVKAKYPDTVLLFRMGDFYETFDEDAKITSRVLGIVLTKRGSGAAGEVPLAGFPHHALESYLPKLVKAGHRVAICEQLEDPKLAKGIVKRDVVEIITPGVAYSDKVLDKKENNYLLAVSIQSPLATSEELIGIAFADVTTAEFKVSEFPLKLLPGEIASLSPSEILVQKRDKETIERILRNQFRGIYTKMDDWIFSFEYGHELLTAHFKTKTLKGFGAEEFNPGITAAGAIMHYLQETQKTNLLHMRKITPYYTDDHITLDRSTKRNLEIVEPIGGPSDGTLFRVLDRTQTPMGGRLLKKWISFPLRDAGSINGRLSAVSELSENHDVRKKISKRLSEIGDLERLITKICTNRANPREVASLKSMLENTVLLISETESLASETLAGIRTGFHPLTNLIGLIDTALSERPPMNLADGDVIRSGYNAELDELRDITLNGKKWIADLQRSERDRTGIHSLKVGYNNVFGYYIEITHTHKEKVPERYIRKQTLSGAERYITPELKEYEEKILNAEEKILSLESKLFNDLRLAIAGHAEDVQENAHMIAMLDCFTSLADAAVDYGYTKPEIDEGTAIEIVEGRHPVIERLLPPGEQYTPNDTNADTESNQIMIITGPNMSGKSSYLRQTALIVLMAQTGSFVPAKKARIGLVDRIYTRVGASDSIASGESTFLVEMHEAANIVNTATKRSLILLDEIGRGTSTFDGISIAWAITEYIHNRIGAKTLFATHYHELNELADLFPRIRNLKVDVREYGDKVVFLHKVTRGFADHSYGIQVAQMAGLPEDVTERAKKILKNLEGSGLTLHEETGRAAGRTGGRIAPAELQLTLFEMRDDKLRDEIKKIDLEKTTPLQALHKLAELQKRLGQPLLPDKP